MNSIVINRKEVKQTLACLLLAIGCTLWIIGAIGQLA